jgi:hypothetical protein
MGLTLKYVKVTSSGTFHYRRRVPKDMAVSTGQTEFKRFLGKSEREALRNYPQTHAFHERLIEEFRNFAHNRANLTALEAHELAERKAADLNGGRGSARNEKVHTKRGNRTLVALGRRPYGGARDSKNV